MDHAIAHFRTINIEVVLNGMSIMPTMRFGPKGCVSKGGYQMPMNLRRGVRCDQNPLLFC